VLLAKVSAGCLETALSILQGHRLAAAGGGREDPALFCRSHRHGLYGFGRLLGHQDLVLGRHKGDRLFPGSKGTVRQLFRIESRLFCVSLECRFVDILPERTSPISRRSESRAGSRRRGRRADTVSHLFSSSFGNKSTTWAPDPKTQNPFSPPIPDEPPQVRSLLLGSTSYCLS